MNEENLKENNAYRIDEIIKENEALKKELNFLKSSFIKQQEEISKQEQRFKSLSEATGEIVWVCTPRGDVIEDSPSWRNLTGQSIDEYLGLRFLEAVHPDDLDNMIKNWLHYSQIGSGYKSEYRLRKKDGTYADMCVKASPVFASDGTIREWVGVNTNITDEKKNELNLKSSEEKFRFLSETIPQLVWTSNPDGVTDYFNDKWEEYTGINLIKYPEKRWGGIIHPDDTERSIKRWKESLENGIGYEIEYRIKRYDGVYRWFIARAIPFKNKNNEIIKWFGTATDIDDQKTIEEKQKFLIKVSTELITLTNYQTTLENITKVAVPYFSDWCKVDVISDDQKNLKMIAISHKDFEKTKYAYELDNRFPRSLNEPFGSANVIRTGKSEFIPEIKEELWKNVDRDNEFVRLTKELGFKSIITVPIFSKAKAIGTITFIRTESSRLYTKDDLVIAEDIGRKASLAIDNSILYKELQEEVKFNETLYRIGNNIAAEIELNKIVQLVTDEATSLINAQFGAFFYNIIDDNGESYMLYSISGVPYEEFSKFPMPRNTAIFAPTFNGEKIVRLDDVTKDPDYGKNEPYYGMPEGHLPVRSYLAVPVVSKDGSVIGGMFWGHSEAGVFKKHDERLVAAIANQASIAIDNAYLYKRTSEAESKFRLVSELVPQMIWTTDKDGKVNYYNQLWHDYVQTSTEQLLPWESMIHTEDISNTLEKWKYSLKSGTTYEVEHRLKRASDNTYRWHLARAIPFKNENGEIIRWFGTFTDIHRQKETEEKLASVNQELRNFAYVASHDLQEPLRTISSFANLLEKRYKNQLDSSANDFLTLIMQGAKRMSNLITDLLLYSKIEVNHNNYKNVDINNVIKIVTENLRATIQENSAIINYKKMPVIRGNETQIIQLFQNLIANAIKYRSDLIPTIEISYKEKDNEYIFSVSDNGIGIDKQHYEKIFVIFKRLHEKDKYEGTGIGLATCKKIIELHYGKIWLESDKDKGTTFYFSLAK